MQIPVQSPHQRSHADAVAPDPAPAPSLADLAGAQGLAPGLTQGLAPGLAQGLAGGAVAISPAEAMAPEAFAALAAPLPRAGSVVVTGPGGRIEAVARLAPGRPRSLRLAPTRAPCGGSDMAPATLESLVRLARAAAAHEIRTQGKVARDGPLARRLAAAGFAEGPPSGVQEIDVERAGRVLERFRFAPQRLGNSRLAMLSEIDLAPVMGVLAGARMLDPFEVEARLELPGEGRIEPGESPVLLGEGGAREALRGFILIARAERADTREIAMRWVAASWQGLSLINLCLMRDCLARAGAAGVTRARFRAPARNADTLALARRLGGRETGQLVGFGADPRALALPGD